MNSQLLKDKKVRVEQNKDLQVDLKNLKVSLRMEKDLNKINI